MKESPRQNDVGVLFVKYGLIIQRVYETPRIESGIKSDRIYWNLKECTMQRLMRQIIGRWYLINFDAFWSCNYWLLWRNYFLSRQI